MSRERVEWNSTYKKAGIPCGKATRNSLENPISLHTCRKVAGKAGCTVLPLTKKSSQALIERGEFSRLVSVKKCPVCGGELEEGYFNAPRGVYWGSDKHKLGLILMDYVMPGALWSQDNVPALRCTECGIAIVDYRAPGHTPKSFLKKCVRCREEIPIACEECQYCGTKQ